MNSEEFNAYFNSSEIMLNLVSINNCPRILTGGYVYRINSFW